MAQSRLNFVFIVTDQHRADHLACYANPDVHTPNIDRLAREGVLFNQAFVANPVCMPNRASMFTGRYPKAHRLRENGMALGENEALLPEMLRRAGYQTQSVGKIHLAPYDLRLDEAKNAHETHESRPYWDRGGTLPLPFRGFERVYFTGGHGNGVYGDYKRELERDHPGEYEKMAPGAAHVPATGAPQSWKSSIPEEHHHTAAVGRAAIRFIESRDATRPFFLWCSFPDPHHPFCPPRPYCDQYDPHAIVFKPTRREGELNSLPPYFRACHRGEMRTAGSDVDMRAVTEDHLREIIAHTYGMISMVDTYVGKIIESLERAGLLENTVVVFLSDHGDLMGDHWLLNKGPFLFRGLLQTPLVWRMPGGSGSIRTNAIVSAIDILPTVLEIAGVDIPEGVQGQSYLEVLRGNRDTFRPWAYIEFDESYLSDRLRQLRSAEWALTFFANNDYGMLYDLEHDPDELDNLWSHPSYTEIKDRLIAELLRQSTRADDWLPQRQCHA